MATTEPIPPAFVPGDHSAMYRDTPRPDNGWPGPMPLTRTLPKLDATERPMRLLSDALGRARVRPWAIRPTASGEGVVLTLGVDDVEQLSRSIVEPDADPSCEGCCW